MKFSGTNVEVRDVQMVELEILLELDRICKKHNIPYQLFAGTLLGAVRHKGFIPWDDDIDVCLLRKDYRRFVEVCQSGDIDERYFLQTNKTDPKSVVQFAKIRKNGTVFENETDCDPRTHTGIYIDVFPMDKVKPYTQKGKRHFRRVRVLYAIITSSVWERVKCASTAPKKIMRALLYCLLKIVPKAYFDKRLQNTLTSFEGEQTEFVSHLSNGDNLPLRCLQREKEFLKLIDMEFEGCFFPVPANYDEVLTRHYGDYMQLPPEEARCPSHGVKKVVINQHGNDWK